jgi:hypothetical protein
MPTPPSIPLKPTFRAASNCHTAQHKVDAGINDLPVHTSRFLGWLNMHIASHTQLVLRIKPGQAQLGNNCVRAATTRHKSCGAPASATHFRGAGMQCSPRGETSDIVWKPFHSRCRWPIHWMDAGQARARVHELRSESPNNTQARAGGQRQTVILRS